MFDLINSCYELGGALVALLNIRAVMRDKSVKGTSCWTAVFFTTWGIWNVPFYLSLGQVASACCSVSLVLVNSWWLGLVGWYKWQANRMDLERTRAPEIAADSPLVTT